MKDWTFKGFSDDFDAHVREQLPWYEFVTESVAYITRNYVPDGGYIYDIGCSTGNMSKALLPLIDERNVFIYAIDSDEQMLKHYEKNIQYPNVETYCGFAQNFEYQKFDVAILMLVTMFLPVSDQRFFIENLYDQLTEGGAIIIVDKVCSDEGYFSTVMKRLTMYWKLKNGAKHEDIINKELSLSGIQRPLDSELLASFGAKQFFQLGEFKGWVIEK
jgi:tRNA (cmo5U34)-methyltransferase